MPTRYQPCSWPVSQSRYRTDIDLSLEILLAETEHYLFSRLSRCRSHNSTQPELGENHFILASGDSERLQVEAGRRTLPELLANHTGEQGHGEPDFNRSREPAGKGCSYKDEQPLRRILLKNFPGTQEVGPVPSSDKLWPLNSFVKYLLFKMEGIEVVRDLLQQGDWLARVDLKDAYFSVPIHSDHHRSLIRFIGRSRLTNSLAYLLA